MGRFDCERERKTRPTRLSKHRSKQNEMREDWIKFDGSVDKRMPIHIRDPTVAATRHPPTMSDDDR